MAKRHGSVKQDSLRMKQDRIKTIVARTEKKLMKGILSVPAVHSMRKR